MTQLAMSDLLAQTKSGALSQDEIWSGTVVLEGDITVPAGITLTIQPGAVVKGGDFWQSTYVNRRLDASGTESAPILFTSQPDAEAD